MNAQSLRTLLVQRLGFFLDLHEVELSKEVRTELKSLVKPDNKIYLTSRGRWNIPARFNSEWIIVENVPKAVLTENIEGGMLYSPLTHSSHAT